MTIPTQSIRNSGQGRRAARMLAARRAPPRERTARYETETSTTHYGPYTVFNPAKPAERENTGTKPAHSRKGRLGNPTDKERI